MQKGGRFRFRLPKQKEFHLYQFTDIHLFNSACAEEDFKERVRQVADDPYGYVIGTGDYIEGINYDDVKRFDPTMFPKGFDIRALVDYGNVSFNYLYDLLKPIRHKILGMGYGNHEGVLMQKTHSGSLWTEFLRKIGRSNRQIDSQIWWNPSEGEHGQNGVADLRYCSLLDLIFTIGSNDYIFRVGTHHGAGYAQTDGSVANRMVRFMNRIDCDIFLMGHLHRPHDIRIELVGADETLSRLVSTRRLGVIGSTYLKTYNDGTTTYAEKRGYDPTIIGNPMVTIQPESRSLGVVWS